MPSELLLEKLTYSNPDPLVSDRNEINTGILKSSGRRDIQSAWRPFSSDSPWNTPLSHEAVIDPHSTELIADFAGGNVLLAESSPAAVMAWEGLLSSS